MTAESHFKFNRQDTCISSWLHFRVPVVSPPIRQCQLCTTPYIALAFAETRDSLSKQHLPAGRQD